MTDATDKLPDDQREIGETAVWSVSSAKPGFGVEKLRDDDIGAFVGQALAHGRAEPQQRFGNRTARSRIW